MGHRPVSYKSIVVKLVGRILGVFVILVVALFLFIVQPGPSGVVASLRLPDGSEYMIVQRCNWSTEPYDVSFYMRSGGGQWGWCYIDHQADRWHDVAMTYNPTTDIVTVTQRGRWQAALDRGRSMFSIGDGKPKRELAAPQELHQPGYPFPAP